MTLIPLPLLCRHIRHKLWRLAIGAGGGLCSSFPCSVSSPLASPASSLHVHSLHPPCHRFSHIQAGHDLSCLTLAPLSSGSITSPITTAYVRRQPTRNLKEQAAFVSQITVRFPFLFQLKARLAVIITRPLLNLPQSAHAARPGPPPFRWHQSFLYYSSFLNCDLPISRFWSCSVAARY